MVFGKATRERVCRARPNTIQPIPLSVCLSLLMELILSVVVAVVVVVVSIGAANQCRCWT